MLLVLFKVTSIYCGTNRDKNALIFPKLIPIAVLTIGIQVLVQGLILAYLSYIIPIHLAGSYFPIFTLFIGLGAAIGCVQVFSSLLTFFEEKPEDIDKSLDEAVLNRVNSKSLHFYTSRINKEYSYEKKLLLIEILWDVVLSDGNLHDYESSLIRRLSGLLYIDDIDSGNIKRKCLTKLSGKS